MNVIAEKLARCTQTPDSLIATTDAQLFRAMRPEGEGACVFIALEAEKVRAQVDASRVRFAKREARSLEGVTIAIKDLFDVAGEVTCAGSQVLRTCAPATADAPVIARLRAAGATLFGRTNMTEFAFSGIGINPFFGTPRSVWGRTADGGGRVPGGSSSGAGVSVAERMCDVALGTDTGGSVRIPAAFNGLVGFKPTAYRVPVLGSVPLSVLHDSIGPLARTVDDCARVDAVLSASVLDDRPAELAGLRFLMPRSSIVWSALDPEVERATLAAIARLRAAGATVVEAPLTVLDEAFQYATPAMSAFALDWHDEHVGADGAGYDPRVWQRLQLGKDLPRAVMSRSLVRRRFWIDQMQLALLGFDAVLCPTVACIAPELAPLIADDALFTQMNGRVLRNTGWVNALDGCAITLPCHGDGDAPVGLQLVATHGQDSRLLAIARACESIVRLYQ